MPLFRQLTVFSGGWSLEAVEAVCHSPEADPLYGVIEDIRQAGERVLAQTAAQQASHRARGLRGHGLEVRLRHLHRADGRTSVPTP